LLVRRGASLTVEEIATATCELHDAGQDAMSFELETPARHGAGRAEKGDNRVSPSEVILSEVDAAFKCFVGGAA
jgi:hypothetical protein